MTYVKVMTKMIEEERSKEGRTDVHVDPTYAAAIVICIDDANFCNE